MKSINFNAKFLFFVMIGVIVLLASLTVASVVFGDKLLQKKTDQLVSLKLDSKSLDAQQRTLIQAKKDIEKYSDLEKTATAIVPQEKDQAKTVREIIKIAQESNITISNISFPSSTLGQQNKKSTPPTGATTTPNTTPTKSTTPPTTQVKPVEGINGVYQLEINVQTDSNSPVQYQSLLNFLNKLEQNRRTAQVTNISIQPHSKDRNLVIFSFSVNVYIKS
ncbi:hypothetical protein HY003_02865 [Candidatus Saccharibacteria bacterium]|nr:hypothetical protein [Candidatus Saccharibacteria bacterium]MBI3338215.1 hypothetical protein [Candidatus Saccharibacteria bacterium]